ncbi:MAG: cation diffusion facilitator family transporter [Candidatus Margulisbacteria bacterium]|nr:cation diffusion facilitator family transporter [Candidatus Margulisiibacteriota bacterium]
MSKEQTAIKTAYFSILGNTCLAIIKWFAGFFGNSYAIKADAIESTSDIFSSIFVLFGIKYSSKPADRNYPYGYGKAESLITFLIVAFLAVSASIITYQSIQNLQQPHASPEAWTLYVLGAIILWKEGCYRFVLLKSKKINSSALKADAWHHRSDAITSIAAFIGISVALLFGKGFEYADDWAALFAAAFIFYNCFLLLKTALAEIMDEHLYDDLIISIKKVASNVDGIIAIEKCLIRKSGMNYLVDMHATLDANLTIRKGHAISHALKDKLKQEIPELISILIHIEPN